MIDYLRFMQESSDTELSEALTTCQVCCALTLSGGRQDKT